MRKSKQRVVEVREDDVTVIQIEVSDTFIEFYKKETGHRHVTQKGLSKFLNHLVEIHRS